MFTITSRKSEKAVVSALNLAECTDLFKQVSLLDNPMWPLNCGVSSFAENKISQLIEQFEFDRVEAIRGFKSFGKVGRGKLTLFCKP